MTLRVVALPSVGFNVVGSPLEVDVAGFAVVGFPVDAGGFTVGCPLKVVVGFAVIGDAVGPTVVGNEDEIAVADVGRSVVGRTGVGRSVGMAVWMIPYDVTLISLLKSGMFWSVE